MSTSDIVWIAVATHPNAEGRAVQNLKRQGYECYCPRTRVSRRHARRIETVERPFFPGYLFVRLDRTRDQWRPIMHSRGVRTVVRFGEKLGVVPQGIIESLLAREGGRRAEAPSGGGASPGGAAGLPEWNLVR